MTNKLFVYLDFFVLLNIVQSLTLIKPTEQVLRWQNADAACTYSGCFLQLSEIYHSCTCSSWQPITLSLTFISLFVCQPRTHTRTHTSCVLRSSLLGHGDQSRQRHKWLKDGADKRGFEEQRKEGKKKGGGAESNLQVWLFGHVPVSPHCPLLYLSTCSSSPLFLCSSSLFPRDS